MDKELSVVILCYKAGERIYALADKISGILKGKVPSFELVLVGNYNENSDDDTPAIVKDIEKKNSSVKAVALPKKGMMGWDARSGLEKAESRYICLIDGDGQMPPEDIIRVYDKIKNDNLDLVLTYRKIRHDGFLRTINSRAYNLIFKILFPGIDVRDVNSKPKIFTGEAYRKMRLTSDDWFLDAEMMLEARRLGLKIAEIPTEFYRCGYRRSFIKPLDMFEFTLNMLKAKLKGFFKHNGR